MTIFPSSDRFHRPQASLSGAALKTIACLSMLLDHLAKALSLEGPPYILLSELLGRMAFPLFCLMLVEGFFHTRRLGRYLGRLLFLALVSEIFFDMALYQRYVFSGHQNTVFTLFLGLLMLSCLEAVKKRESLDYRLSLLLQMIFFFLTAAAAELARLDYGALGIATIAAIYYTRSHSPAGSFSSQAAVACLALNLSWLSDAAAFLSLLPVRFYQGQAGKQGVRGLFYLFYPLHLAGLVLLRILL